VEALVQGEDSLVAELIHWCRRGPPAAKVDGIEEKEVSPDQALKEFLRKETE
jgi:acylphosphatase